MSNYELTVILRISENLNATRETVGKALQKHGAVIKSVNEWGRRKMAYPIDRTDDGFYLIYTIDAAPDAIKGITAEYRLTTDILRFLFVRLEEVKTA